ncbi:MAG: hypothetical protein D6781_01830 [Verrucomicrobia bacterium]|nr:MAG: hypothetical protein D6781_01830 [Verrucomicrobiota bacterium]
MNLLLTVSHHSFRIPESDWLRFGILLLVLLALLQLVRLVSRTNKYVLLFIVVVGGTGLMASWVHNRNEPAFLTPVVDILEPWFPKRVRTYTASSSFTPSEMPEAMRAARTAVDAAVFDA